MEEELISDTDFILSEFETLREEILDRLKNRIQYEMLAYSIFMSLIGISAYVGYSIIILIIIQILLFPLILMVTQLVNGALRLGAYLAARIEVGGFTKKLPWEYLLINRYREGRKRKRLLLNISSHIWLLFTPALTSFVYLFLLVLFSNSFVEVIGQNVTWDMALVNSNVYVKLILLFLSFLLFLLNIYSCSKYAEVERERSTYFEEYRKELSELYEQS